MKLQKSLATAISLVLMSSPAFAQGKKKKSRMKKSSRNSQMAGSMPSYGMAGCGLGALIIKEDSIFMQLIALWLNGSSNSQTFGITTGTSGCDGQGPSMASLRLEEQRLFVSNNFSLLSKEAARGQGDMLNSLASLAGCTPKSYEAFAAFTQGQFENIFISGSAENAVLQMNALLRNDDQLSKSCMPLDVEESLS